MNLAVMQFWYNKINLIYDSQMCIDVIEDDEIKQAFSYNAKEKNSALRKNIGARAPGVQHFINNFLRVL